MYIMLLGHSTYGNHHLIGYGYKRLVNSAGTTYLTYIQIIDGQHAGIRYLDLNSLNSDHYWKVCY